jgi:inhibitor of growth protein 3
MASNEDCASVLEQFMHDAANLPAEISHMMEEIQAKDKDLQKYVSLINQKDSNIQKHLKGNGVLAPHPKENEYGELVKKNYDLCMTLQDEKIKLSEKACLLLDRQVRKLDVKIRELQSDGQLQDGPPLPSIFNRKAETQKPFLDLPTNVPLQNASINALNASAHRINAQMAATMQQAQRQLPQIATTTAPVQRNSAPATPAAAVQQQRQREREHSLGAENKRRKLGNPLAGANLPAQPSGLRQSSLGPGTPKAGTPTGTSASRAGSIPRTSGAQQASAPPKKSGLAKKIISHQQVNKLKQKAANKGRVSGGRKKGQSPSVRGGRGGTAASEDADSVLSSADASETDASQSRRGRGNKKQQAAAVEEPDVDMGEDEDMEDDEGEDDKRYCFCNQRSYGEMVACENDDCPYQWFHTGCLNMKKVPDEDEDWYCPTCREKPEIIEKVKMKKKPGRK